ASPAEVVEGKLRVEATVLEIWPKSGTGASAPKQGGSGGAQGQDEAGGGQGSEAAGGAQGQGAASGGQSQEETGGAQGVEEAGGGQGNEAAGSAQGQDGAGGRLLLSVEMPNAADGEAGTAAEKALFRYGNIVALSGAFAKPAAQQNEFLFDYQRYLYARNLSALFYADYAGASVEKEAGPFSVIGAGIAVRDRIEAILYGALPARDAALITAILLGKKDGVDDADRQNFMDAGILHIMSVSGLHVAMLGGMVLALFRKAGLGINRARLASLCAVAAFVFIAGFSASVVRAALAFGIAVAAKLAKRDFDSLNAIGASMCVLLAANPMLVFNAGFELSFAATLSIILLARKIEGGISRLPAPKWAKSAFAATAAAQLGVFPVQAMLFNSFQPFSIVANIAVSPLIGAVMAAGWAVSIFGAVSAAAAAYPAYALICIMAPLRKIPEWIAAAPFSAISVGTPGKLFFAAYYALLALVFFGRRHRRAQAGLAGAALLAAALAFEVWPGVGLGAADAMEISFLDVGNANAAYINVAGKYDIVVDAGGKAEYLAEAGDIESESRLYEYLLGRGARKIDLAVVTHGDSDHMQGFWKLLSEMEVRQLLVSGTEDENLSELVEFARQKGVGVIECRAGGVLSVGGLATIEVKSPDAASERGGLSLNERSLVARFVFGEFRALFCGDIGFKAEERMLLGDGDISAQLISVPHHGSRYSSGEGFLDAVGAGAAVFGVGRNSYGHPSDEAVERYRASGARILRTDRDGMVTIRAGRDGSMEIKCYNDSSNSYAWQRRQGGSGGGGERK
ncbi:MAG: DNA internalization-related competence protein ComEC/Rec2, partial [Clostridiales bacterium]|nr:DNA internalization-related competence protein ComEC/Rec2 [Clostridiales bacterium]